MIAIKLSHGWSNWMLRIHAALSRSEAATGQPSFWCRGCRTS